MCSSLLQPHQQSLLLLNTNINNIPDHAPTRSATMSTAVKIAYPPGGTFWDTIKTSFVDVPVDANSQNAISTTEFLQAAESLTTLFGASFPLLCMHHHHHHQHLHFPLSLLPP